MKRFPRTSSVARWSRAACLALSALAIASAGCKKSEASQQRAPLKNECRVGTSPVKRVLFLGVDGCRTDALVAAHSPEIESLLSHSYVSLACDRGPFTLSAPGWSTLLRGVWPAKHGIVTPTVLPGVGARYPDVFARLRKAQPALSLATVTNWSDFVLVTTEEDAARVVPTDAAVKDAALDLLDRCTPDVLLLHFDEVDHEGHASGFTPDNPRYLDAIRRLGGLVGDVMKVVEKRERERGEEWLVVLATDHGGIGKTHERQDDVPATRQVFLAARLPHLERHDLAAVRATDVAPTILRHMSVPVDPAWDLDGQPLF